MPPKRASTTKFRSPSTRSTAARKRAAAYRSSRSTRKSAAAYRASGEQAAGPLRLARSDTRVLNVELTNLQLKQKEVQDTLTETQNRIATNKSKKDKTQTEIDTIAETIKQHETNLRKEKETLSAKKRELKRLQDEDDYSQCIIDGIQGSYSTRCKGLKAVRTLSEAKTKAVTKLSGLSSEASQTMSHAVEDMQSSIDHARGNMVGAAGQVKKTARKLPGYSKESAKKLGQKIGKSIMYHTS